MKWTNGLILAGVLIATLVASDALACSPLQTLDFRIAEFATPDRIAYTAEGWAVAHTVTVTDAAGNERPGTQEMLDETTDIYLFVPDEPLASGSYDVTIVTQYGDEAASAEVVVPDSQSTHLSLDLRAEEVERSTGTVCCSTEPGGCTDSCGRCTSCWPAGYEYVPRAHVTFDTDQPLVVTLDFVDSSIHPRSFLATSTSNEFEIEMWEPSDADVCIEVTTERLDGELVSIQERCVDAAEVERLERRTPDAPDEVAACAEPPEETDDPNWQRYGASDSPFGGCNTAEGGPSGWPAALLIAVVLLARRSRRHGQF